MRILLVDDDYLLAKGTAKLLERLGSHRVKITDDPIEILRQCRSKAIDIVLMDVNLPAAQWEGREVSGVDIAHLIKSEPETADIPIILITAYAMLADRQRLLNASLADDFCSKPITDYPSLLNLMAQLHESRITSAGLQNQVS